MVGMRDCTITLQSLQKGHEWPKLKIISALKSGNKATDGKNLLPIKSAVGKKSYCLVPAYFSTF